mmetsp:Transcript_17490/g.37940  ORF Transcript_17490/g.37940 Transcript_17490/m.37940 type:complete len:615 (-) Transcript_17490:31-1875(-)
MSKLLAEGSQAMEPSHLDSTEDKFDNDENNGSPSNAIDAANDLPDDEQPKREEAGSQVAPAAEAAAATAASTTSGILKDLTSPHLRPFAIISTSYLLFTVTDGAIRMIVLLHAYNLNFSALEVAIMFTLYELAGAVTNLAAGVMGAKWGIKSTLIAGLILQLCSYGMLFGWNPEWNKDQAIIFVTFAQMLAGIAKDLTKLGGKTVTKLVTPEEQTTRLFKLVSLITGWKNSLKGVGYFLGSALLQVSYECALGVMMGLIVLAMPWAIFGLDNKLGTAKKKNSTLREIFVMDNRKLNILSLARLFLFASRDFWFEVPLPFYLRSPGCEGLGTTTCTDAAIDCTRGAVCGAETGFCENINDGGGCGGLGLGRTVVGAFLGGYIILYGQVQSWTPQIITGPLGQTPPNKLTEVLWGVINCLPTLIMGLVMTFSRTFQDYNVTGMTVWLIVTIVAFAIIFAVNSSIHSFLVVSYAKSDKVAVSVGFYYMSNALGRLMGTIGSGLIYTYAGEYFGEYIGHDGTTGLAACFFAGTASSAAAAFVTTFIDDNKGGLKCGKLTCISDATDGDDTTGEVEVAAEAKAKPLEGDEGASVEEESGDRTTLAEQESKLTQASGLSA